LSCLFFLWRLFPLSFPISISLFLLLLLCILRSAFHFHHPSFIFVYFQTTPRIPKTRCTANTTNPPRSQQLTIETLRPGFDLAGQRPNPATDVIWQT
jgi:hypothetical protein